MDEFSPSDRIDISIDLLGAGSIDAVQKLTEQISRIESYYDSIASISPEARVAGAARVSSRRINNVNDGVSSSASQAHHSTPLSDGAGASASYADYGNRSFANRFIRGVRTAGFSGAIEQEMGYYGSREREQLARRSNMGIGGIGGHTPFEQNMGGVDEEMGMAGRQFAGGVSASASGPSDPTWRQAIAANPVEWERAQEGIRLPPGGLSINFQDKLDIASRMFTGYAERKYQRTRGDRQQAAANASVRQAMAEGLSMEEISQMGVDPSSIDVDMSGVSRVSGTLGWATRAAAENAATIQAVSQEARRFYNWGGGLQRAGASIGYERAGEIGLLGIGIQNPFAALKSGSATREGIRQRIESLRLRAAGGINGEQANQIVGSLAGIGWSGTDQGNPIADTVKAIVQQGQDPSAAAQSTDLIIRQGNASLDDVRETIDGLGESARAANMSLSEYQEGLNQFALSAKERGATTLQGMRQGRQITDATGLSPQVANEMFNNPIFQGYAASRGYIPNAMGLMGTNESIETIYQTLDMVERGTSNWQNQKIVDPVTGHVTSGRDMQIAQMATITGMSPDVIKRLLSQEKSIKAGAKAGEMLSQYQSNRSAINARKDKTIKGQVEPGDWVPHHGPIRNLNEKIKNGTVKKLSDGTYAVRATVPYKGEKINEKWVGQEDAFDSASDQLDKQSWDPINKYLKQMATSDSDKDRVRAIGRKEGDDRIRAAQKFIREKSKVDLPEDDANIVHVKFTGLAEKFFKEDRSAAKAARDAANAGDKQIAEWSTSIQKSGQSAFESFLTNP